MRRENDTEGYQPYIKRFLIFYSLLSVSYILVYKIIASSFFSEVDLPNTVNAYMTLIFVIITGLSIYVAGAVASLKDILSRRKGFEALTGNDDHRYGSLKNTPAMLQTTDSNGRLIDVSDYWLEIFGFEREEVIGRKSTDFLTEESRRYFLEAIAPQFFETGICRDVPCQLKRKNGEIVEAILSANVIKNAKGNFLGSHASITDITKFRQVENSLRDSEEILQKIVYAIPDIFIRTDVEGNILFVNNMGLQKLSNYSADSIVGRNVIALIDPEDKERATLNFRLMFEKPLGPVEYSIIINDSERIACEINGDLLRHVDRTPYGIVFIIRDITQRKKLENELKASEEKFRAIVETTPDLVWEILPDGTLTYISPQTHDILGYTVEQIYQKKVFDLVFPEELPRVTKQFNDDLSLRKRIIAFEVEVKHGVNGKKIYLEINSTPILSKTGELIGLRGVARDITIRKLAELEIKKSKEALEMVLESGNMGLLHSNVVDDITYVDDIWALILGYSKEEFMGISYKRLEKIFYPDDIAKVNNFFDLVCSGACSNCSIEHRVLTKDGEIKWVLAIGKVVQVDADGKPAELIILMKDITEQKYFELKIIEANATKDKLFSVIAHDLRNPFTNIIGFSELLITNLHTYNEGKISEMVHHINSAANNIYSLLENLLEWANSQRGKTSFNPTIINLAVVVNEEIEHVTGMAQQKGLVIRPFNVNFNVYADYNLLKIIIRNLITNAIKYSNTGGVVGIFALSYADRVEVCVSDSGVGMNDEIKNNLFKNGGYASMKGTANEHGTGLGLLLCKEFIEKHNGNIWVESKPAEGSQFTFSLPNQ